VIEFGDSYVVPADTTTTDTTSGEKSRRTVTLTREDMQRKKNAVKARTTLLLSLPDEHQLSDLDTMSLDDLYNHLKVYESEVQKKTEPHSQNMAFISSAKHNSRNEDGNTTCVPTASTNIPTASASVATISEDTACTYIASQSSDGVGRDWSYMENEEEDHTLVADEVVLTKFALMANTSAESKVFDNSLCSKDYKKNNDSLNKCADDTVTDYSMPSPTIERTLEEDQNRNPFVSENVSSLVTPKPFIEFVKPKDSQSERSPYRALWVPTVNRNYPPVNRKFSTGSRNFPTVNRKFSTASRKFPTGSTKGPIADIGIKGKAVKASVCNISYLSDYEPFDGGYVSFVPGGCKITGKGTIKTGKLEFENVYFVKDLKTPQQNGVTEKRNRTLIEAARTMLADAKLPVMQHTEAVNTTCYVQNRVLVNKSHNKTPYELFNGRSHAIGFLKPFGCHVMILNTSDHLGKFKEKGDEGYFIRYSMSSKAFRVFNKRTRRVEENLHVEFLENKAIEKGAGPNWLFDIDSLTKSMNYVPVNAGTISINLTGTKDTASQKVKKVVSSLRYIALLNWAHDTLLEFSSSKPQDHCSTEVPKGSGNTNPTAFTPNLPADHMETLTVETLIPTVSSRVPTAYSTDSQDSSSDARLISKRVANQEETPSLDNILLLTNRFKDILGEPKKIFDALQDPSWVEAMQEELFQFKIQKVWTLVDCLKGVRPIGTKWVLKNKKDERGIVIRNKARLVAQGHTQKEEIDYDEVFAPIARIETIRLFLAYASFMGFTVYQIDVKSAFLYGTIDEEVYVMQPLGFQDPDYPAKVYKVEKAIEFEALMHEKFQMSAMGELNFFLGLQVLQKEDGIFLSQDKIETKEEGTKILATVDGILRTITESSLRKNLKLQDEEGIISLPDTELFENLSLMGYNISQNQKFTIQKGFNEFNGNIATALGEGSGTPTEPYHTPSLEAQPSSHTHISSPSLPTVTTIFTALIPTVTPSETTPLRQYTRRARIVQFSALPPVADEPASYVRDVSLREACPTEYGFIGDQDRTTIAKSSTLPYDSVTRVTSPAAAQEVEINKLKERVKLLEDGNGMAAEGFGDDVQIKGRREVAAEKVSDDTEEMATVLIIIDATSVLSSGGVQVVPTAAAVAPANVSISTGSGVVPTASTTISTATLIFATATIATSYTMRMRKEKMVETHTPKKKKRVEEQIDIQFVRELEEELEREAQRMNAQIARDEEIAKIHVEEELQQMIAGLDRSNETITKHLEEYDQAAAELTIGERIELISELVKYQDHHYKKLKYQAKQRKSKTKKQKRDFYMAVIRNNLGGVSKILEGEDAWLKRKGIRSEQESAKKQKTTKEVPEEVKSCNEIPEEKIKELIRLVPIEEVYVEALQFKHPIIDWKLQVENYSQMATDLVRKIQQIAGTPSLQEELLTAREERYHCLKKREATARKIALLSMTRRNYQSKMAVTLNGSAEVHENYDNNEIFNMFTQEEQYTELLEPIPEPQQVPQNDNTVISEVTDVEQDGEIIEQHSANFEETRALYESLYQNLAVEVEKVNSVNRKLKETNADLTTELA
nr:putative ribonuclease H-like domain-containing protein [Tanacetum cinerariifolium]